MARILRLTAKTRPATDRSSKWQQECAKRVGEMRAAGGGILVGVGVGVCWPSMDHSTLCPVLSFVNTGVSNRVILFSVNFEPEGRSFLVPRNQKRNQKKKKPHRCEQQRLRDQLGLPSRSTKMF
jgi:hypothetical protein